MFLKKLVLWILVESITSFVWASFPQISRLFYFLHKSFDIKEFYSFMVNLGYDISLI